MRRGGSRAATYHSSDPPRLEYGSTNAVRDKIERYMHQSPHPFLCGFKSFSPSVVGINVEKSNAGKRHDDLVHLYKEDGGKRGEAGSSQRAADGAG